MIVQVEALYDFDYELFLCLFSFISNLLALLPLAFTLKNNNTMNEAKGDYLFFLSYLLKRLPLDTTLRRVNRGSKYSA